jgi:hypothetical protein
MGRAARHPQAMERCTGLLVHANGARLAVLALSDEVRVLHPIDVHPIDP